MIKRTAGLILWGVAMVAAAEEIDVLSTPMTDRQLVKEVVVRGPVRAVWEVWTTSEGLASFLVPSSKIVLQPGGAYEFYMDPDAPAGQRGGEGCRVLVFVPGEWMAFEWNFPPSIPVLRDAGAKTQVVMHFAAASEGVTRIRFVQHGWREGAAWEEGYAYFDRAWGLVLQRLQERFAAEGDIAPPPGETWRSHDDQGVSVRQCNGLVRMQDFAILIPASPALVWRALATPEGLAEIVAKDAKVGLAPWGAYQLWPGATQRVLAFIPERMLAVTGSAPPQFPTVRKGGTWAVYTLTPTREGHTRLRMTTLGWQDGDEWKRAYDYFLTANAQWMRMVRDRFTVGPVDWAASEAQGRLVRTSQR